VAEQDTLDVIQASLGEGKSFVVEAGAGSGKTRSLIETVRLVLGEHRASLLSHGRRVACITYTNVAKDEIIARLNSDPLVFVGTIHQFMWHLISGYQAELLEEVLALNAADTKNQVDDLEGKLGGVSITYGQYGRQFERGELFHNDVIAIAAELFSKYPKLARIAADLFPFIFVDEYQDTAPEVVELLLTSLSEAASKPVVGFFGDPMQQIYDSSLDDITKRAELTHITKTENYRCSTAVIGVLNRLRPELQQGAAGDNAEGDVRLFLGSGETSRAFEATMAQLAAAGWDVGETKVLVLTHKGIAREIGYPNFLAAYGKLSFGNERMMKREDELGETFALVEELAAAYTEGRYGEFLVGLGRNGYRLDRHSQKQEIASYMDELCTLRDSGSVDEVLAYIDGGSLISKPRRLRQLESLLAQPDPDMELVKSSKRAFVTAMKTVPYKEVRAFTRYVDEHTPFSTKHGVKGAEYPNVLVVIDDALWPIYRFASVFGGQDSKSAERLARSRRLLYVCFSRAKRGLAVLCLSQLSDAELAGARSILGVSETSIAVSSDTGSSR
jgi:DNA helicase-2/ATP-dependent DNA helicase PcrA